MSPPHELGHVGESHDPVVEVDPLVHLAEFDIADDVVEGLEDSLGRAVTLAVRRRSFDVSGKVRAGVAGTVDEGVPSLAVRRDAGQANGAVLVGDVVRFAQHCRALGDGVCDALVHVRDAERDVADTVAVTAVMFDQRTCRIHSALDDKPDGPAFEYKRVVVAVSRRRA